MSKSLGRVFGIAKEGPYGYETDYMQYLSGYNPYNYEQTLKNMIANAANMNPRPPYQIQENQNTMPAYLEPTKAYSPSNSPSDMLYKDWLITNDFLNRLKQNAAENEEDLNNRHPVVRDALYSLSVQHRNAAQIVNQTIQELHQKYGNNISDSMFLNALYKNRAEYVRSLPESEYKGDKKITKQEKYNIINKRYPYELNRAFKYLK